MWVRILSGNQAGLVVNLNQPEAEQAIGTGFARAASRDEWERFGEPAPATAPHPGASRHPSPSGEGKQPAASGAQSGGAADSPISGGASSAQPSGLTASKAAGMWGKWHVFDANGEKVNDKGLSEEEAKAWAATGKDPRAGA